LPRQRVEKLCEQGWGELHQFADYGTEMMIYGPRDYAECDFVFRLIVESVSWAREENL